MSYNNPRVLVLMSTYNGEAYLREQLESLVAQKGVDLHLLVRDDGSSDQTISILEEFECGFGKVTILREDNIGAAHSFLRLMRVAATWPERFDYYAFSDQDDWWLDGKLSSAIIKLRDFDKEGPSLYCSQTQMIDSSGTFICTPKVRLKCKFAESLIIYGATGCTEVFNYKLLELVVSHCPTYFTMHHSLIYQS